MGPGYFGTDTSSGNIATQIYDEMYGGTINHAGWLGSATEGFQTSPRIGGTVLYRDFSNGRVWLNVRGSSPVTIDMTGFQRLNHNESLVGDAAINNGATGGTYSLAGGDAIFALRAQ
jgi:hypothetical protein